MQDESVQFRQTVDVGSLMEQKAQLQAALHPVEKKVFVDPYKDAIAKPIPKPATLTPEIINAKIAQEKADIEARDRMQGFSPKDEIPVPASLWAEIHGQTMLKDVMGLPMDNAQTEEINNYILNKMRIGRMEDTKENFEKVLGRLLAKNNLSMNQQKNYLVKKLSLYLYASDKADEVDDLVLSILNIKRGKRHGVRR